MSIFREKPEEILNLLKEFNRNRRRVLFGDAERFKNWLKNLEVKDKVIIKRI